MATCDEKKIFELIRAAFELHDRTISKSIAKIWLDLLAPFDIRLIENAFQQYFKTGTRAPLPADILKFLPDPLGHMSPEEAWAYVPKSEAEGGYLSSQMMSALAVAIENLEEGNAIGARIAFLDVYKRAVDAARTENTPPEYFYSPATSCCRETRYQLKIDHAICAAQLGLIDPMRALSDIETSCQAIGFPVQPHIDRLQKCVLIKLPTKKYSISKSGKEKIASQLRLVYSGAGGQPLP